MRADFKVLLDACVLANAGVCDLFLRLSEAPRLLLPKWSEEILDETTRTHVNRLKWPAELSDSWRAAVEEHFPEAMVVDYGHLVDQMTNDPKDRHVLAAAIRAGADLIVTFNLKDFPDGALGPWHIEAVHPQDYLLTLYGMAPQIVVQKINDIARDREVELVECVLHLGKSLPSFAAHLIEDLGLNV